MLLIFKCFESVRTEPLSRRAVYIIILDIRIPQSYALLYTTTGTLSVIIQIQRVFVPLLFGILIFLVVSNTLEGPRTHSVTFTKLAYSTAITQEKMEQYNFLLFLVLTVLCLRSAHSCMCDFTHPQNNFCSADFGE